MGETYNKRNEEIEVLRAVAVLFVLIHHYPALLEGLNPSWYFKVEGLWSGVDLFFCISGYVIGRSLISDLIDKSGKLFWKAVFAFWIKRWYRIVPSAWLWIVALVAFNGPNILTNNAIFLKDAMSAILHYANIHFYLCTVGLDENCQNLHVYWSLSLEEQFYILIPFAIFLFRKKLGFFMLLLAVTQMLMVRHQWQGLLAFIRTDAIALGVLLSVISRHPIYLKIEPRVLISAVGPVVSIILIAAVALVPTLKPTSYYMGLLSFLSFVLVWIASYAKGYLMAPGAIRKWAVKIGERSFSIYLAHIVAFAIAKKIVGVLQLPNTEYLIQSVPLLLATGFITLFLLVELSYRFVEIPWRTRGRLVANRFNGPRPNF